MKPLAWITVDKNGAPVRWCKVDILDPAQWANPTADSDACDTLSPELAPHKTIPLYAGTAPSPVGLPEEPKRYSFDGAHNVAPEYVKAYDYDALRTAAEHLRDENLEIKRAHLDEHLSANAAEQRVVELEREVADLNQRDDITMTAFGKLEKTCKALHGMNERAITVTENWQQRAEQLQCDLDAARARLLEYESHLTVEQIQKIAGKTDNVFNVAVSENRTFNPAHREPAGGEDTINASGNLMNKE